MKLARKVGSTSQIFQFFIQDSSSTVGAGLTALTQASGGLTAYYHRDTDTTATAVTLVTMTVGTFTSSGFKEIDATNMPGWYQFCPPNASLASGAASVAFHFKGATNMAPLVIEIDLDVQVDTTFWNGTAVATPATAGVPDVNVKNFGNTAVTGRDIGANVLLSPGTGTGQLDFTSGVVKANSVQWLGGAIPAVNVTGVPLVDAKYLLGTIFSTPATAGILDVNVKNIKNATSAGAAGYVGLDWAAINAPTTAVNFSSTTIGTVTNAVALGANDSFTSDSGTAQAGAGLTITLRAGALATDNLYNGCLIKINSGTGAGQARVITGYVGSTKVATIDRAWQTNPDNTSVYTVVFDDAAKTDSSLAVTAGTVTDKTAYSLTQAFPTRFSSLLIDVSGRVDLGSWLGSAPNALISGRLDSNVQATAATLTYNLTGNVSGSIGSVTNLAAGAKTDVENAVWNAALSSHVTAATFGLSLQIVRDGTAQAGGGTTITLDAGASATTDFYKNDIVQITGGTGAGQARFITAYNGSTKVATVNSAWATNPDATSVFVLRPFDSIPGATAPTAAQVATAVWTDLTAGSDFATAGSIGLLLKTNIDTNIGSRLASGNVTVGGFAAGAIAAAAFSAGAIDATAFAQGAADRVWTTTARVLTDKANFTLAGTEHTAITADVWDAARSGHTTTGTFGKSVAATGDQMDLINAPNATAITAIQSGLATAASLTALAGKFTGITLLANWLRAVLRKDAPDATALTEINTGGGGYNATTDSQEAIRDRGDAAWITGSGGSGGGSAGDGDTPVNQDTGGTDNLRATINGSGLDNCAITAYVASEWAAAPVSAIARGKSFTQSDGRWAGVMMLNSGITYTFVFNAAGYVVQTKNATV